MTSRLHRLRQRLAYRLHPNMNEFNVAVARNKALIELSSVIDHSDDRATRDRARRAYRWLSENVVVREEWMRDYGVDDE